MRGEEIKGMIEKSLAAVNRDRLSPLEAGLLALVGGKSLSNKEMERILTLVDLGVSLRLKDLKRAMSVNDAIEFLKEFNGKKARLYYTKGLMDAEFLGKVIYHPFIDGIVFLPEEREVIKFSLCYPKDVNDLEDEGIDWRNVLEDNYLMIIERLEKEAGLNLEHVCFIPYEEWRRWVETG